MSVAGRSFSDMSPSTENPHDNRENLDSTVFDDPVGYLASFGINAELVAERVLPAAA